MIRRQPRRGDKGGDDDGNPLRSSLPGPLSHLGVIYYWLTASMDWEAVGHVPRRMSSRLSLEISRTPQRMSSFLSLTSGVDDDVRTVSHWKILVFGQALSLLRAAMGTFALFLFQECAMSAPAFQMGLAYCLLACGSVCLLCRKRGETTEATKRRNGILRIGSPDEEGPTGLGVIHIPAASDAAVGKSRLPLPRPSFLADASRTYEYHLFPCRLCPPLKLTVPWWYYALIALFHVEGNYLVFLSFRHTTFTSVSLFVNLAVPSAMMTSHFLLKRNYRLIHFLGAAICLLGVAINVYSDYDGQLEARIWKNHTDLEDEFSESTAEEYPSMMLGDALAIMGGLLLGLNDVLFEMAVRTFGGGTKEFLPMLGIFGVLMSAILVFLLERDNVAMYFQGEYNETNSSVPTGLIPVVTTDLAQSDEIMPIDISFSENEGALCRPEHRLGLLAGYVVSTSLFISGAASFLTVSEAALLNLSYLTEDWWSVIFSVVAIGYVPQLLFWVAMLVVLIGVFLYEMGVSPIDEDCPSPPLDHSRHLSNVPLDPSTQYRSRVEIEPGAELVAFGRREGGNVDTMLNSGEGGAAMVETKNEDQLVSMQHDAGLSACHNSDSGLKSIL